MTTPNKFNNRRHKRIQHLLEDQPVGGAVPELFRQPGSGSPPPYREWGPGPGEEASPEPDPEDLWKRQHRSWNDDSGGGGGRPRFGRGLLRRTAASALVFGAVWGIFAVQEPWALRSQYFITNVLSNDMDFAAVQVWYEEHFNGAPSFIPIFGDQQVPAEKVTADRQLGAPLAGIVVSPFTASFKGIEILPSGDSSAGVTVKSVDTGRVLSVSKETSGGVRVTVRHTAGLTAEYGHLSGTQLAVDDWVQSGDAVGWIQGAGEAERPLLFLAMMKDKSYIDPAEVVSFD
ncbi:M23 family metallopeptidase [Paenibacillus piscarius]|uniref:M23 family metallopeptidase n=1 Tax=Paenibacillus piscarius TaxID=1089681 RepID=UPI001EE7A4BA|nr:M23 family metallopeptidase [Paenibacillus piscarius]